VSSIRADFPILARQHRGKNMVYLDSAATTQKPKAVIEAVSDYYLQHNANVHRAAHKLADEATAMLEGARSLAQEFINAPCSQEIVFTRGTTEAINLVANVLHSLVNQDDEILITVLEHHSNIVPWQMLAQRTGAKLVAVNVDSQGNLDLADFHSKLGPRTKIFACSHVSNALGTVNPITQMVSDAANNSTITVVDGAQAALHETIDVQAIGCDFYAFSGHKMYAPTGIGVLFGKLSLLDSLPPWQGGGEMIEHVTLQHSTYQKPPYKFEAGTPNIAGAVGLGAAIKYLGEIPRKQLIQQENELLHRTVNRLQQLPGIRLVGEPTRRSAVISFLLEGSHPHDIGTLLDQQGVAVRTGHHCAMPLMEFLGIPGTIRASFSLYNNDDDTNRLIAAVEKAATFL